MKKELEELGFELINKASEIYLKKYGDLGVCVYPSYGNFHVVVKQKGNAMGVSINSKATIEWIKEFDSLL